MLSLPSVSSHIFLFRQSVISLSFFDIFCWCVMLGRDAWKRNASLSFLSKKSSQEKGTRREIVKLIYIPQFMIAWIALLKYRLSHLNKELCKWDRLHMIITRMQDLPLRVDTSALRIPWTVLRYRRYAGRHGRKRLSRGCSSTIEEGQNTHRRSTKIIVTPSHDNWR